jgi:hypothetical protein
MKKPEGAVEENRGEDPENDEKTKKAGEDWKGNEVWELAIVKFCDPVVVFDRCLVCKVGKVVPTVQGEWDEDRLFGNGDVVGIGVVGMAKTEIEVDEPREWGVRTLASLGVKVLSSNEMKII